MQITFLKRFRQKRFLVILFYAFVVTEFVWNLKGKGGGQEVEHLWEFSIVFKAGLVSRACWQKCWTVIKLFGVSFMHGLVLLHSLRGL